VTGTPGPGTPGPDRFLADLEEGIDPNEARALTHVADRLARERPVPSLEFRSRLRRQLVVSSPRAERRPANLRALIAGYAMSGSALLLVAALSSAGVGPLAA
jgi:hypothetical protein